MNFFGWHRFNKTTYFSKDEERNVIRVITKRRTYNVEISFDAVNIRTGMKSIQDRRVQRKIWL